MVVSQTNKIILSFTPGDAQECLLYRYSLVDALAIQVQC